MFLPSIWVCHIDKKNKIHMDIQSSLYKFCKEKRIDKVLRMDNDITYWNISDKYIGDNKTQMKLKEKQPKQSKKKKRSKKSTQKGGKCVKAGEKNPETGRTCMADGDPTFKDFDGMPEFPPPFLKDTKDCTIL